MRTFLIIMHNSLFLYVVIQVVRNIITSIPLHSLPQMYLCFKYPNLDLTDHVANQLVFVTYMLFYIIQQ